MGNYKKNFIFKIISSTNILEEKDKRWKENLKIKELKRLINQLKTHRPKFYFWNHS